MTRHRPTEERRAQILAAARQCFLERGFHATKVERIARQAGLSKGAVYFHFENKRALLEALVEAEFTRAREAVDEAAQGAPLTGGVTALLAFLGDPADERHRFFLLTGELAVHDEALRERLVAHHTHLLQGLEDVLQAWQAGAVMSAQEARGVAVLLKAMADGLQGSWALGMPADGATLLAGLSALIRLRLGRPEGAPP
ncbi:MAG: TetR/AcrR family transcriptional regulator [Myxococcales bacterium]|nr:TetR/AcrR family transcriptional regulator [Myxococcales bacterium]